MIVMVGYGCGCFNKPEARGLIIKLIENLMLVTSLINLYIFYFVSIIVKSSFQSLNWMVSSPGSMLKACNIEKL